MHVEVSRKVYKLTSTSDYLNIHNTKTQSGIDNNINIHPNQYGSTIKMKFVPLATDKFNVILVLCHLGYEFNTGSLGNMAECPSYPFSDRTI